MISANTNAILSLLLSVQYTHEKDTKYDYSNSPRPCHNIVFMLEGEGVIISEEKIFTLHAGDILFIPKNTTYVSYWKTSPKVVFHSLHFSFQPIFDPFKTKSLPIQQLDNTHFQSLYQHLKNLESVQFKKGVESFKTVANFYSICASLFPQVEIKESKLEMGKSIAPAINYIETNYATNISVEDLSKLCYLSPSRFHFLFKKYTGYSPIVYKNHISIQHAAQELLLNPSISISTVAEKYGFSCTIYFTRLFKKMMGKSPLQYRKHGLRL